MQSAVFDFFSPSCLPSENGNMGLLESALVSVRSLL